MERLKIDKDVVDKNYFPERKLSIILWMLATFFVLQSAVYISRGSTYLDEGHFFNFSLLVYRGKLPYLDFWYYQPPLFPYIYGLPQYLFGPNMYLARATSFLFFGLILILVYKISKRMLNRLAGMIALILIIFNPYTVFHFNSIELYSLAGFFLLLAIYWIIDEPKMPYRISLSVFFMSLALAVRLSMGATLLALMIYIFITERNRPHNIIIAIATLLITCGLIWGPFLFLARDQTVFGNIGWYLRHTELVFFYKWSEWNLLTLLRNKFDTITEIIRNFISICVLLPVTIIFILRALQKKSNKIHIPIKQPLFLLVCFIALFIIHLCASPSFPEYFLYSLPIAAILSGFCFSWIFSTLPNLELRKLLLVFLTVLIVITPFLQGKRAIPKFRGISNLSYINKVAGLVKKLTSKDDEILTFNQQFAAVADRVIVSGLEFSYPAFAPDWGRKECEKYHLYNTEILLDWVTSRKAKVILLTDHDSWMFNLQERYEKGRFIWGLFQEAVNKQYNLIKKIDSQDSSDIFKGVTYIYIPKT